MKALEERRKDLMASYPVWKKMTLYQGLASKAAECPNHVFLLAEGNRWLLCRTKNSRFEKPVVENFPY